MDFTEIAMQKFSQTAPELVNLIVAFRDISQEASSDIDVLVGAFVLQSGGEAYFIPVVQKDQTIHPIDSVFVASQGVFRPLTKNTVNYILNSSKLDPGKAKKVPRNVSRNPSVYDLVTPPRTGKFVYASSSRLLEFLSAMPNRLKGLVRDHVSQDSGLANSINQVYGIEDFVSALRDTQFENKEVGEAPAKAVLTYGDALDEAQAREVLEKGYTLNESYPHASRVAIPQEEFEYHGQLHEISPSTEGGKCFRLVTSSGRLVNAYVLKEVTPVPTVMGSGVGPYNTHKPPLHRHGVVLTESGRILPIGRFVAVGDELTGEKDANEVIRGILNKFTSINPIKLGVDIKNGQFCVVLNTDLNAIVAGKARMVTHSSSGTHLILETVDGTTKVCFVRGLKSMITDAGGAICVPVDYPVLTSSSEYEDYSEAQSCEKLNINMVQSKLALDALISLGDKLDIAHDGVDFSLNGDVVGPAHKAIEILIVRDGIEPRRAESFIKSAAERKSYRVLMSKKAEFTPGEIPEFGEKPQPQSEQDINRSNVQQGLDTMDKQVSDAMILSELLQANDLFGLISEYLPEISEAVDRLGRILFMSRVRMDQLVKSNGSESALSTIASLKAVYRNLGDNLVKLEQLTTNVSKA